MRVVQLLTFLRIISLTICISKDGKPTWSYELVGVETKNETPDIVNIQLSRNFVSRGVYKVFGEVQIKQDLTDDLYMEIQVLFNPSGTGSYVRTPFQLAKCKLSHFMNSIYKPMFMETLKNCSENSMYFTNTFELPLTKRVIKLNNCLSSSEDNMPSYMKPGYYRVLSRYSNQAKGFVAVDVLVMSDN